MLNTVFPDTVLNQLSREVDRFIETTPAFAPRSGRRQAAPTRWPAINAWREGDAIVAEAELPGFRMEDVEVLATDNAITIRGIRESSQTDGATPLRLERTSRSFERTLRLPLEISTESAKASMEHGVLRVTLPVAAAARPRRIEVTSTGGGSGTSLPGDPVEANACC